jgi:hypothetical protein
MPDHDEEVIWSETVALLLAMNEQELLVMGQWKPYEDYECTP